MIQLAEDQVEYLLYLFLLDSVWVDGMAKLAVKFLDLCTFNIITESYTDTMSPSTSCTPNTMQVTFWFIGETKVNDCFNIWDIEATRNKISSKQIVYITSLELLN